MKAEEFLKSHESSPTFNELGMKMYDKPDVLALLDAYGKKCFEAASEYAQFEKYYGPKYETFEDFKNENDLQE